MPFVIREFFDGPNREKRRRGNTECECVELERIDCVVSTSKYTLISSVILM